MCYKPADGHASAGWDVKKIGEGEANMLDFKELGLDGQDFELLIREILFRSGYHVVWSGRGPDGGRDILCSKSEQTILGKEEKSWLVQCKHFAHSERSVGIGDLDDIVTSASQHSCTGYLLACSTFPSSGVVSRLEGIQANKTVGLSTHYWDAVHIERILSTSSMWRIAQTFFPKTAREFEVFATEDPNHWVVNYRGFYFHMSNRIGSARDYHLPSIAAVISNVEDIQKGLPEDHHLRVRSVYYDDKNGGYKWFVDYLRPHREPKAIERHEIAVRLKDEWVHEDGQYYSFDIALRTTSPTSDHFDVDHYEYYRPYLQLYRWGGSRQDDDFNEYIRGMETEEASARKLRSGAYESLVKALQKAEFLQLVNSENCSIEAIRKYGRRWDWSKLHETEETRGDRFFSTWFLVRALDKSRLHSFISRIPQDFSARFRLSRPTIYLPSDDGGSVRSDESEDELYELTLSVDFGGASDLLTTRETLNEYMRQVEDALLDVAANRASNPSDGTVGKAP